MSALLERIREDLKSAMREKDGFRRDTLRLLKSSLDYALLESGKDSLPDDEVVRRIRKEVGKRIEARDQFLKGDRSDMAEREERERAILEGYLPRPLTPEEIREGLRSIVEASGASGMKDMSRVVRTFQFEHPGRADGRTVSTLARELLTS